MWQDFHFLNPLAFLALLPLGLLLGFVARGGAAADAWRRVVDPRLLAALRIGGDGGARGRWPLALLALGWLLAVLALANPTFERQPVPAFRNDAARVVVLDLSQSMLAGDLSPTRLDRARYKLADILARSGDGQVGLVAFAGDAFAVSPLTDDAHTILGMVEALSPEIMPVQGSRVDLGLEKARELLDQAGARDGEVVLLTDDAGGKPALETAGRLREAGHRLAVIGVGTRDGGVVPGVRTSQGPVIAKLDTAGLRELARAGGGAYARLSASDTDLNRVLRDPDATRRALAPDDPMLAQAWKELGPWLTLALVPLGALAFRRGWVLGIGLLAASLSLGVVAPRPAMAAGWDDLWQRREQQADAALAAGDFERARELAQEPMRSGAAAYRLGDYAAAAEAFAAAADAEHQYNRGNALARAGRIDEAIAAYDAALAQSPDMEDALYNKRQLEKLRQQQEQQQQQGGNQGQQGQAQGEQGQDQADSQSGQDGQQSQQGSEQDGADDQDASQQASGSNASSAQQASGQQRASGQDQPPGQDPSEGQSEEQDGEQDARQAGGDSQQSEAGASQQAQAGADQDGQDEGADGAAPQQARAEDATGQDETADGADAEQAAADYRAEAQAAEAAAPRQAAADAETAPEEGAEGAEGDRPLTPQEQESRQAADQWLRRIPDDPAGLLRRKFQYQYRARVEQNGELSAGNPW
jgi:Ca-activated chloride channel family protein